MEKIDGVMNENQIFDGIWWIHGDSNPPSSGTLSLDLEKGLKLTIKIPRDRTPEEFWKTFALLEPSSVPETTYGRDQNKNDVSLLQIETKYYVWLLFTESKSAKEIRSEYVPIFLHFLCLLTGERIFAEEISFFEENPFNENNPETNLPCELLDRKKIKEQSSEPYMLARFIEIKSNFESIMKRWFECHQRMRPVLDLFFAVLPNQGASYQTQFLLLAQALEVYHGRSGRWRNEDIPPDEHARLKSLALETVADECRDWLKRKINNRRPVRERIDEILNFCSEENKRLTANIVNFTTKVADSRNYYTHYSQQLLQSGQVAKGPELVEIRYILEYLLKICLLKEAGLEGKPIERALAEKGTQKFIHLEKPKS